MKRLELDAEGLLGYAEQTGADRQHPWFPQDSVLEASMSTDMRISSIKPWLLNLIHTRPIIAPIWVWPLQQWWKPSA